MAPIIRPAVPTMKKLLIFSLTANCGPIYDEINTAKLKIPKFTPKCLLPNAFMRITARSVVELPTAIPKITTNIMNNE